MADLKDLISQASSNQSGTQGKASLLDYADKPQQEEAGQEAPGQNPMLSQQDVDTMSRQGAVSAVENQIDPGVGGLAERDRQAITDTGVDPELIFEGNAEKFGKSLVAGTGIVVNDIGNMMDYAAMTILPDEIRKSDTFMQIAERLPNFHQYGDALQNWGKVHQSPGLDEFTLDDMFKMEFWATDVAKTLPYMAAMIVPGAQGAGLARGLVTAGAKAAAKRGLFGSAKQLVKRRAAQIAKGSSKAKIAGETAIGGEGVMGAIATAASGTGEIALSGLGTNVANFLGSAAGTTGIIGAGLAGDVYNRAIDMGMSEDEAQTAAHGTFVDNSKWFALNGLSWGMQFGGLSGRAFKQFNRMKGGAESAKVIQKTFAQRLRSHAAKGVATGTVEGTEEMFQETYETWIQDKNLAEARGEEFVSYTDFLTSDENRKTLGVSFAAGFLMGGRGGFMDSVAENGRRITNKRISIDDDINSYENMSDAQKKVRTNETIEAAIREDQVDGLNVMLDKLQAAGKISADDRAEYDATIVAYSEIASTLPFKEKLTEAGQQVLFNIKVKELQSKKSLENLDTLKAKSIQEANENLEGDALSSELSKIENEHTANVDAVKKSIAEGKQGVAKLLSGKKYTATSKTADTKRLKEINDFITLSDNAQVVGDGSGTQYDLSGAQKAELLAEKQNLEKLLKEDSYAADEANFIAETSLTQEEKEQFTLEGETEKAERQKQEAEDKVQKASDTVQEGVDAVKGAAKRGVDATKAAMTKENIQKVKDKVKSAKNKVAEFFKSKSEFKKSKVSRAQIGAKDSGKASEKKSVFGRAKDFFSGQVEKRAFIKAIRPFDETIKNMNKEGKSSEEIVDEIYNNLTPEQQEEFASDFDGIQSILDYVTIATGNEIKSDEDSKDESVADEDAEVVEETEEEAETEDPKDEKTEDPKVKKPESKKKNQEKIDSDLTYAEKIKAAAKKLGAKLANKNSKKLKEEYSQKVKDLFKEGFGTIPNREKKMKTEGEAKESKPTPLQYFSTINPALESAIISAASKKFPTKQLLILREVISQYGGEVAGMAMGSAVQVTAGSNVGNIIMHEYGHVYYNLMKDNPSFKRGVSKIIKSKVFRDTKDNYSEELLYNYNADGQKGVYTGQQIFQTALANKQFFPEDIQADVDAFLVAHEKGDAEAQKVLFDKVVNGVIDSSEEMSILPDSEQSSIIEEAFVISLTPQMAGKLNLLFDKGADVVQYEGFISKLKGRVSRLITPKDAKDVLKNVDNKYESMSIEEINNAIIDDISTGVNKGKFSTSKPKFMKFGKLSKEIGAIVSVEISSAIKGESKGFDNTVEAIINKVSDELKDPSIAEDIKDEVEYRLAVELNRKNNNTLSPDGSNSSGVARIYDKAGYNKSIPSINGDNVNEDEHSSEIDEYQDGMGEDNVNVVSSDYQKQLAMDNSSSHLLKAIMMIANPVGKNRVYQQSRLEAEIYNLAKANRNRPAHFIKAMKRSTNGHIVKLMEILESQTEPQERLSILNEFHNSFRNKFQENITYTTIKGDGNIIESEAIASSEKRRGDNIISAANNVFFASKNVKIGSEIAKKIATIKADIAKGKKVTMSQALRVMAPILYMSDSNQYLDMDALVNIRVAVDGKQLALPDLVQSWVTDKNFEKYFSQGKLSVQTKQFKGLVNSMVIKARAKNAIKTVTNVEGKATSVMNMNSHLLNQQQHIIDQAGTEEGRSALLKKYPGNPLVKMIVALGAQGLEQEAIKISIDGGTVSYTNANSKAIAFQNKTKEDVFFGDLEQFVNSHDGGKPGGSRTYYTQPISIFSNSKRRYSIQMPMITTKEGKINAVNELKKNKLDKKKYKDGTPVLDLDNKSIANQVAKITEMIMANPGVLKDNPVLNKIASIVDGEVVMSKGGLKILNDYAFNYALNTIYAQELLIGSHTQSKSQSDYIKRATGAIARHDGSMRGVSIEPIIIKDVVDNTGFEETDAGSFILPEDVGFVQDRVGPKMGHLFKFVHYGTDKRGENANENLENEDTYLKTAVHVLTPEMIGDSEVLKNIAKKLRERRKKNGYGESLNIAIFESGAKKFPNIHGDQKGIEHDADFGSDSQAQQDLDNAYMLGNKLVGIDGANMGIQLPMDKDRDTITLATQHVSSNNNDLTSEEALVMDEIQALEAEIFDANLNEATGALMQDKESSTPESREAAKTLLGKVLASNAISSVSNGAAKLLAAANSKISQNLPGLHKYYGDAIKSLIKKSSKIVTNGTIAIQATSVGKGLKAYTGGVRYNANGESRAVTLPAETIVPASLKGKYMARVNKKFNSLDAVRNHINKNMVRIASSKGAGIKIEGLDRSFDTELEAKNFLYNKVAKLASGDYVILGEEYLGSRIPAHGNQSRVVMEITGFQTEVKSKDGKHKNNAIQVPAEVNKVLGSDHDGDSIFMNFQHHNPKSSTERKVNEYLKKTIDFYQKPARFEEITADLEIKAEIDARVEAIKSKFPSRVDRSNQNTPVGAAEFFEENVLGSGMVGNVAALNNGINYLSRYGTELGFQISINEEVKKAFNNDYEGDYKSNSLVFQGAKTLQIVLDNANNQQATALGLNPSTIVAGAILPRLGFSASEVDIILNSTAAKIYTKHAGKKALRNRNFSYVSAAESALNEMLGKDKAKNIVEDLNKNPEMGVKINTKAIEDRMPDYTKEGDNDKMDNEIEVIKLLHKLDAVGQDVYTLNNLVGQHKTVPSNRQEALEMMEEVDNLFKGESALKGETELNALAANPVIKSFRDRVKSTSEIYAKNQLTGTWHAKETFDLIKQMVGGDKLFKSVDGNQAKILNDYMLNIIMNFSPKISKAIGKYAKSKDGEISASYVMERLQRFKKESLAIDNDVDTEVDETNQFLNAVVIRKQEGFKEAQDKYSLSLNRDYINEQTRPFEILEIQKDFAKLPVEIQEMFIAADAVVNGGGLTNSSVSLLFDNNTLISISKSIDSKHQEILNETTGAISKPEIMAEAIIVENADIVSTAERFYDNKGKENPEFKNSVTGKFGEQEIKLLRPKTDIQKSSLRANKEHYIKTQKGSSFAIYKWVPASKKDFDKDNWERSSKNHGKYVKVGMSKKGAPTRISNLVKLERAAKTSRGLTSLINQSEGLGQLKMKMNNTRSGNEQGFTDNYEQFTFEEYLSDKGYTVQEVNKNKPLKEALEKLHNRYKANFNLAQEFDRNIVQTGKLSSISEGRLTDYALLFQNLDPSAISGVHRAVVLELAKRAANDQKASRNGIEWTDKGDISWLHAWFGSNNISGNRPEIQKLVREMEKEYDKFMDENVKFQTELERLTKNLVRDKLADGLGMAGKVWNFTRWFTGGLKEEQNSVVYGNMYDKTTTYVNGKSVPELKLKSKTDFLRTNPSKAEKEFYNFFVETTTKYGNITKKSLGERFKKGYIPHIQTSLKESIRQRGLFGLYDHMLQGTGDIDGVRVKGTNPITNKTEILPFHEWKYLYYSEKGVKNIRKRDQVKFVASLDIIRKRAEKLAKSGKHEDGKPISMSEQEIHGTLGTNLMSRFTRSRGVKASMFGSQDLGRALSQYVNTTLFTYGNENFSGFKSMSPLLDGVIRYNKEKGNKNAVTYLENVWKKGFYNMGDSQMGLGRLADSAIHKLVKLTRIRYLSLSASGGIGNLTVGKYNEFRSKGGKKFIIGEKRYWGQRKKAWALIKKQMDPEKFAFDLIQGNDTSGFDTLMMSPYIGTEHYIQGSGFVSQFTDAEWNRISEDGEIPADMKEKVDLYIDNVVRQQGYGYSKVDQVGIATYSWGKAIMQFKKWVPTAVAERFGKETIDRFGQMRAGSNATAFAFGADFARGLMAGDMSASDFKKEFRKLPEHKKEAVKTFFRGMQVVSALTALSMLFGESDDDELRGMAKFADDSVDDIMFLVDPRRIKNMAEPASWSLVESGATMAIGMATMNQDKFKGGLSGISWTASQVLSSSSSVAKSIEQDIEI